MADRDVFLMLCASKSRSIPIGSRFLVLLVVFGVGCRGAELDVASTCTIGSEETGITVSETAISETGLSAETGQTTSTGTSETGQTTTTTTK